LREYLTLKQLRTFSFNRIERLQNLRFKATCRYMLPATPFYTRLFHKYGVDPFKIKKVEDWHSLGLPLIKKATYMKNPKDFVVQPDKKHLFTNHFAYLDNQDEYASAINLLFSSHKKEMMKRYYTPKMIVFSGGTESGNPTPVMFTATQKLDTMRGLLKIIGGVLLEKYAPERTVGMNLFPYGPHLAWQAFHEALDLNADLNLCTAAGGAMPTERLVMLAGQTQPNIICGMSDYLRNRFLPEAIQQKIRLPERVIFINAAQKMHNVERTIIAQLARQVGVKQSTVLDLYGASEFKEALLPECQPGSGFHHIAPLSTIIKTVTVNRAGPEVIDDWDFSPTGYATGWNIDGAGTVLAGYFLGDNYGKVIRERCEQCKCNVLQIHDVNRIREVQAQLELTGMVEEKIKGARVNLVAYREKALSIPGVREVQVVLKRKRKVIELRYVADKAVKMKLEHLFRGAEIRPKLVKSTFAKLQGKKIKYEAILIE